MHVVCSAYAISIQTVSGYFEIISVIIKCYMTVLSTSYVEQKTNSFNRVKWGLIST